MKLNMKSLKWTQHDVHHHHLLLLMNQVLYASSSVKHECLSSQVLLSLLGFKSVSALKTDNTTDTNAYNTDKIMYIQYSYNTRHLCKVANYVLYSLCPSFVVLCPLKAILLKSHLLPNLMMGGSFQFYHFFSLPASFSWHIPFFFPFHLEKKRSFFITWLESIFGLFFVPQVTRIQATVFFVERKRDIHFLSSKSLDRRQSWQRCLAFRPFLSRNQSTA